MNTMREKWDVYETMVIPKDAGPIQRLETKSGFYAGALSALEILHEIPDVDDDAGAEILEELWKEVLAFLRGRAIVNPTGLEG